MAYGSKTRVMAWCGSLTRAWWVRTLFLISREVIGAKPWTAIGYGCLTMSGAGRSFTMDVGYGFRTRVGHGLLVVGTRLLGWFGMWEMRATTMLVGLRCRLPTIGEGALQCLSGSSRRPTMFTVTPITYLRVMSTVTACRDIALERLRDIHTGRNVHQEADMPLILDR